MRRRTRDEEESFDVFSLDLLRAKRQILRYSLDEKLLLTRVSCFFIVFVLILVNVSSCVNSRINANRFYFSLLFLFFPPPN